MDRRLDELGRICLPREFRKTLNIKERDFIRMTLDGNKIILQKSSEDNYDRLDKLLNKNSSELTICDIQELKSIAFAIELKLKGIRPVTIEEIDERIKQIDKETGAQQ